MAKTITTRVVLAGKDVLSPVVASAVAKSTRSLNMLQERANRFATNAFSTGRTTAAAGLALAAPITYAIKEAAKFEDEMTSLGKVVDLDVGSVGLKELGEEVKRFSEYTGQSAASSAQMYTNLAQGGIVRSELATIAKDVANISIAFDTVSDQAGESYIKIKNAIGYTIPETKKLFDAVNYLSDKTASKASELVTYLQSGGAGVARAFNIAGKDIAAFGATMISSGKSAEESATITERMAKNIFTHNGLLQAYKKGGRGLSGFIKVLETGNKIMDEDRQTAYFKQFGEYGNQIRQLAKAMNDPDGLINTLKLVGNEQAYVGSVQVESARKMKSTMRQWNQMMAMAKVAVIDFGDVALPVLRQLLDDVKPVIKQVQSWIKENPDLALTLTKVGAALSALSLATSGLAFALGGVVRVFTFYRTIVAAFAVEGAVAILAGQTTAWATSMLAAAGAATILGAPVWLVAAGVAAVGYAFYQAYDKVEWFHLKIIEITTVIESLVDNLPKMWDALKGGDFSLFHDLVKANQTQNRLNIDQHMTDWRKNRPAAYQPVAPGFFESVEQKRAGKANDYKNTASWLGTEKGVRESAAAEGQRTAFNILSQNTRAQDYSSKYLPSEIPQGQGPRTQPTIEIKSSPVFNIQPGASVTEQDRAKLMEVLGVTNEELARRMKDILREQERKKVR